MSMFQLYNLLAYVERGGRFWVNLNLKGIDSTLSINRGEVCNFY